MTARNHAARFVRSLFVLVSTGTALAPACQSTPGATGGAQQCVYGEAIQCVPDGGSGTACARTCLPDLSDYGPCLCSDGGDGDAGAKDSH